MPILELGISENGNDCWGWTDPASGREIAIMGGNDRTVFIEISDPFNPLVLGYLPTATTSSLWRDIKVYNDHAFVVSEADDHGMQVFDLNRLMEDFIPPLEFDVDADFGFFGYSHNIAINEESGYAYPVGTILYGGGPVFINIQDPQEPTLEGGFAANGYTHDAQVIIYNGPDLDYQCHEIFFGFNENTLTIVDISDKSDPELISTIGYEQTGYTHQGWLSEDRTKVYLTDETDEQQFGFNSRTLIMDVTDLDAPFLAEEYYGSNTAADHDLYVLEDKIFLSSYKSGLRVLEITENPEGSLAEVGYFDTYPPDDDPSFGAGSWSNYPYFESGVIVVSGIEGMHLVRSETVVPTEVDTDLVDCITGIDDEENFKYSLHPNPVRTVLTISFEKEELVESILIMDQTGRSVLEQKGLNQYGQSHQVDLRNIAYGIYTLSINNLPQVQTLVVLR
jgi:choice-of-anchor B domain-containing protein